MKVWQAEICLMKVFLNEVLLALLILSNLAEQPNLHIKIRNKGQNIPNVKIKYSGQFRPIKQIRQGNSFWKNLEWYRRLIFLSYFWFRYLFKARERETAIRNADKGL